MNTSLSYADIAVARVYYKPEAPCIAPMPKPAPQRLRLKTLARELFALGVGAHISIAAEKHTHLVLALPAASPRNSKSKLSPAQQEVIWKAAEAKRARKHLQNLIDNASPLASEEL